MTARWVAAALAVAFGAGSARAQEPPAAGAAGGRQVSVREIRVERPGAVRFGLAADEIARLGAAGGIDVVAPSGERFGAERILARDEAPCRDVEIAGLERVAGGYRVRLRVPADAGRHASLDFDLDRATLAAGCRLESSSDGRRWEPLAEGDLYRLGEPSSLARTRLDYPPTGRRELRLSWPAAAGYPRIRGARVCAPVETAPLLLLSVAPRRLDAPHDRSRFALAVPSSAVRFAGLVLELPAVPAAPLAWRLSLPQGGSWYEIASGRWPERLVRFRIDLGDVAFAAPELRLELFGPAVETPTAHWDLSRQVARFEAAEAGTYRIELPAPARTLRPARGEPAPASAGPPRLESGRWPTPQPGAPLAIADFQQAWRVTTKGIPVGAPALLPLPDEVLASTRVDRGDLRLVAAGRQVPARLETAAAPELSEIREGLDPASSGGGRSALDLELEPGGVHGAPVATSTLTLSAGPAGRPFRRGLSFVGRTQRPGVDREQRIYGVTWSCAAEPPLPCEVAFELPGLALDRVRVEFQDGDSSPLSGLTMERRVRRRQLVFLAPAGELELVAGSPATPPAAFDLAALDAALGLASPARAELGAAEARHGAPSPGRARGLLFAAVAAVALALLLILRRLLPARPPTG